MPHIIAEYTSSLDPDFDAQAMVDALHRVAVESGLFDIAAIRTRAIRHDTFKIADGDENNGFVHVVARIREGRSDAQKQALADGLLQALDGVLQRAFREHPLAVTVEIHDITQLTVRHNTIRERAGAP